MNDLVLYIFRQDMGESHYEYTFVLEERDKPPVIGNRTVPRNLYDAVIRRYEDISGALATYLNYLRKDDDQKRLPPAEAANLDKAFASAYRNAVASVIESVASLLRFTFWPDPYDIKGSAFTLRFSALERESASHGEYPHLLIASNDSKIPWWLTTANPPNDKTLICELFALGMISLRKNQPEPKHYAAPVKIRVITCPTLDLARKSTLPELELDAMAAELEGVASYELLSGRKSNPLGLGVEDVRRGFDEGRVVLYHGHFNLNTNSPNIEDSNILASGPPPYRIPTEIRIGSLPLDDKYIIFVACETAGIGRGIGDTLGEYLAGRGSNLVGALYPILDNQARTFATALSKSLFQDHLSWGESLRRAREAAKEDGSLFYRAPYCYFGVPWQMSPVFGGRKHLRVVIPDYLRSLYELVEPPKVYSSILDLQFTHPADLEVSVTKHAQDCSPDSDTLLVAALPSVFVADLLSREKGKWVILGPMVGSEGDVRLVARECNFDFSCPSAWAGKSIVYKGPNLTASAFAMVQLKKWGIQLEPSQWKQLPFDCAPAVSEGLADIGLIVAREDLKPTEGFPGANSVSIDTELAKNYGGPVPRILWITKRACMESWGRFYIIEFFKRLNETIAKVLPEDLPDVREIPGSDLASNVWLYRMDNHELIAQQKVILFQFMDDWIDKDSDKRTFEEEDFYDWSQEADTP